MKTKDRVWITTLVKEIRALKRQPLGHSFKRRHAERHRGCRKYGVGSHNGRTR